MAVSQLSKVIRQFRRVMLRQDVQGMAAAGIRVLQRSASLAWGRGR